MKIINLHCHPPYYLPEHGRTDDVFERIMRSDLMEWVCMSPLDLRHLPHDDEYPYMTSAFRSDNETVARLRDRFPDKVIPFVYVDPREAAAADTVRRWVTQDGFRGLKLYPPIGFYPDADELVPFFEAIDDLAIPILSHAGRVAPHPGLRSKYADPRYLEGVALTARQCHIIVGHAGNPWKDVALGIALGVTNMYIDLTTSGGADPAFMKRVADHPNMGARRMVWGSDGIFPSEEKIEEKLRQFAEIGLTEEQQEDIFYNTPARLLGLEAGETRKGNHG